MRVLAATLFAAVATVGRGAADGATADTTGVEEMFRDFAGQFGKAYDTAEETIRRLAIFAENVERIRRFQEEERGTAVYSHLTPFADLTPEEFSARNGYGGPQVPPNRTTEILDVSAFPTDFDWRPFGAVNPVKNQGPCGSCWAFSVVANIEGAGWWTTKRLLSLSEQQVLDCDVGGAALGCAGGPPNSVYDMMIEKRMGLMTEQAYPYRANAAACLAQPLQEMAFITGFKCISTDENQIAVDLMTYGPLSIVLNADAIMYYVSGISVPLPSMCPPNKFNHAVAIVGFGLQGNIWYWTIRNSWGPEWGEQGYFRMSRGTGACGLNLMVATATGISVLAADSTIVV